MVLHKNRRDVCIGFNIAYIHLLLSQAGCESFLASSFCLGSCQWERKALILNGTLISPCVMLPLLEEESPWQCHASKHVYLGACD